MEWLLLTPEGLPRVLDLKIMTFFFASSGSISEKKDRRQKLMFSQSRNPYFPGVYQPVRSRAGAILARGVAGSRYPFSGVFCFFFFLIFQQGFPLADRRALGQTLACSSFLMGLGKIGSDSEGWKEKTCE